jgi:hypothetical protein
MQESQSDEALQRAIADACLAAAGGKELEEDLAGFLARRGVAQADIDAILAAPRRLGVYRSLVRNGLSSVVLDLLPKTRTLLNAGGQFDADLASFVEERGPGTHYLRDVPGEFFAWAEPRWRADSSVPPYACELALNELLRFEISCAVAIAPGSVVAEVALDRAVVFDASARVARYAFAVHEVDDTPTDPPAARAVQLLGYRDAEHQVCWMELTPLAYAILERLMAGQPLGPAVESACAEADAAAVLVASDVARLLADLGDRGVLLGARAALP